MPGLEGGQFLDEVGNSLALLVGVEIEVFLPKGKLRSLLDHGKLKKVEEILLDLIESIAVVLIMEDEGRDTDITRGGEGKVVPLDVAVELGVARERPPGPWRDLDPSTWLP